MSVYRFVEAEKAVFPITTMCRVLEVSASGYFAWRRRGPSARALSDATLTELIRAIHVRSRGTYGVPRVHAELLFDHGLRVGRKRVARLMRDAGLEGVHRRRAFKTTKRDRDAAPAPDLVQRQFAPPGPDQLWVADITYLPTWSGFLYLAVVVDAWSRAVVGWSMAGHLRTELIIDALDMALWRRPAASGVIFHSDRGTQGGFNQSSQHLVMEVIGDGCSRAAAGGSCAAWPSVVAGATLDGAARGSGPVLAGHRAWRLDRGCRTRGGGVSRGWGALVPSGWWDVTHQPGPGLGALSVALRA